MGAVRNATEWIADQVAGPSMPAPRQAPPRPDQSDEAIKAAKLAERRRQMGLSGTSSTWLTGARGDSNAPTTGVKTLLGS